MTFLKLVAAIERQEGYRPGTLAWRNNNPGNLKLGRLARAHGATERDVQGHAIFPTPEQGRAALCALLRGKFAGKTLREIGPVYAEDPLWAENVSKISGLALDEIVTEEVET